MCPEREPSAGTVSGADPGTGQRIGLNTNQLTGHPRAAYELPRQATIKVVCTSPGLS